MACDRAHGCPHNRVEEGPETEQMCIPVPQDLTGDKPLLFHLPFDFGEP